MSARTSIEWTDVTWNPVRGCSLVSAGCANCYAMKQAHRFSVKGQPYAGLTEMGPQGPRWTGKMALVPEVLAKPLHWKKPRKIFVNSMSDLFHEDVPFEFVHEVFATIRQSPQHVYQILTKRPQRMREFIAEYLIPRERMGWANSFYSHVWLGVSIEDQATADERIPLLLQTPAAVRWVSAEPLLGPVDLTRVDGAVLDPAARGIYLDALIGGCQSETPWHLNWVVVGGESGPGSRPCDVAWIQSIKNQCQEAGVPVFVKQLGAKPFTVEGSREAREWSAFGEGAVMDDCGWIHTRDRKGSDRTEWPADLRVREFPRVSP